MDTPLQIRTDTAERLGVHPTSLSSWIKRFESPEVQVKYSIQQSADAEIKRLQKELKRVTQERDILKKAAVYFTEETSLRERFACFASHTE